LVEYLKTQGVEAKALAGWEIGLITSDEFVKSNPLSGIENTIKTELMKIQAVPVVTGYIGKNRKGEITTLGRNGSDLTATLIGSAIHAEEVQIWRAIPGVMTADPRLVENAKPIEELSFDEAAELAYYGSQVLHPSTLMPAIKKNIPVRALNMFEPDDPGTKIIKSTPEDEKVIKSITYRKGQIILNIISTQMLLQSGFLGKVFEIFSRNKVVIDVVATSEISISLTTDSFEGLNESIKEIENFATVKLETDKAMIAVVGEGMKTHKGIAGKVFSIVSEAGVNVEMVSFGASKVNLAFLVASDDVETAVRALHNALFK